MNDVIYEETIPGGSHWSLVVPAGHTLRFTDPHGGANVSLLLYNPHNLLERYNAPDTLKCQHTFKLSTGNCIYSDMGRIFCSITRDDTGWIDTVGGLINRQQVAQRWGGRDYQHDRNRWLQNGHDALLVEIAKYGLGLRDMTASLNLFTKIYCDGDGALKYATEHSQPGSIIELRFEMDTFVAFSTCPHPMNPVPEYPRHTIQYALSKAAPVAIDDPCRTHCAENSRGFTNTERYRCIVSPSVQGA